MSQARGPIFSILRTLVEERCGLCYGPAEEDVFLDKVGRRAQDAGFESLLDYYYFLRYDAAAASEIEALVDALVVNETFFFRELPPLRVIVDQFLLPAVKLGTRPRVWCAASSTGEEPLTLAMLLAEKGVLAEVEVVASDISPRVLARAKSGRFGRRSLRAPSEEAMVSRWIRAEGTEYVIAKELVDAITWRCVNICERESFEGIGPCDVILCRNVLIYFSDATTAKVIDDLANKLKPGGALFVGVSESLLRFGSSLTCEENQQVFFYRKSHGR